MSGTSDQASARDEAPSARSVSSAREQKTGWWSDGIAIALAVLALLFGVVKHSPFFVDDAYISLRYAENLVCCGELTWNIGEYHEGYTNFLYVLMSAALMAVGLEPIVAVRLLNVVAAVFLIALVAWGLRLVAPGRAMALARGALVLTIGLTPGIAIWVLGGLEPVVLGAFLTGGTVSLLLVLRDGLTWRNGLLTASAFSFAVLTRMDAAVFIGATGLSVFAALDGSWRRRFVIAFIAAGIPALVSFGHMAWRISYYGEFFPLTFYTKTGVPQELRVLSSALYSRSVMRWAPAILIAIFSLVLLVTQRRRDARLALLGLPLLAQAIYITWSGADHMIGARMAVPFMGVAMIFVGALAASFAPKIRALLPALALGSSLAMSIVVAPAGPDRVVSDARAIGAYIEKNWAPGQIIALHTAGAIPFYADKHTYIDLLGLIDPVIAKREEFPIVTLAQIVPGHSKGSGKYVLSRDPDIIIAGLVRGGVIEDPAFLTDVELADLEEFARCYVLREVEVPYRRRVLGTDWTAPGHFTFRYYERVCEGS
ncbi:ArnT family glycosyltransferase [Aestuariibius insulae]|uniref:ArnT family glycosyltransferase n=1 Tax=Aestuariibius insulae TaxID=2058287 RepID=UPI00345EDD61